MVLAPVYFSMLWANATSIPLFMRILVGDTFRFGYMYTIFGYDIYLGESLLVFAAIAFVTLLCIKSKTITAHVMFALVPVFVVGIGFSFAVSAFRHTGSGMTYELLFIPDTKAFSQIARIIFISPCAFIGFENIAHSSEEFRFSSRKTHRIPVASVVTTTLIFIFIILLSITAYPSEYASWLDYIKDAGNLNGIKGLPAFYAANHYLGGFGIGAAFSFSPCACCHKSERQSSRTQQIVLLACKR